MADSLKQLKKQFQAQGKYYTPPELVDFIHSQLTIRNPDNALDPTCGAGALLAPFPKTTAVYGFDIDLEGVEKARQNLEDFEKTEIIHADFLKAFQETGNKFDCIVGNPPFSVAWEPDPKHGMWRDAPTFPTKSRADWAFLTQIMHVLAPGGEAVVLNFPGILYRGGREAEIRKWFVQKGWIKKVIHIPGNKFEDTAIATVCLILEKPGIPQRDIVFEDSETGRTHIASFEEIEENDFNLSVSTYVPPPEPEKEKINPLELELTAQKSALRNIKAALRFTASVEELDPTLTGSLRKLITHLKQTIREVEHEYPHLLPEPTKLAPKQGLF